MATVSASFGTSREWHGRVQTRTWSRARCAPGLEQSSDSGRGLSWDGSAPGFDARPAHARWHPAMSPLGADSGFCNLGLCEEVWRGNWLHEEADSSQDQLGGTRLLPALRCDIPAFLSLSNRLLRRCVPADFRKVPGWMSPTKAQAATSPSAQREEGRVLSVQSGPAGLCLSLYLFSPSTEKKGILKYFYVVALILETYSFIRKWNQMQNAISRI